MPAVTRPHVYIISAYAILFTIAIPWYWRLIPEQSSRIVLGAPLWAVVVVFGGLSLSALTALLLLRQWPQELSDEPAQHFFSNRNKDVS